MYLFDAFCRLLRIFLGLFSKAKPNDMNSNKVKIFVKCGVETMIPVYLEPNWTILNLKEAVSSNLCMKVEDLRIIFAGKELHDNIKLEVTS